MTEPEHEHDDEQAEDAPVSPETQVDADEEAEAEEAETPSPEPEAKGAAPKSAKEIEQALARVEKAGTTYRNAVSRAMGEDAQDLIPCPRCNAPTAGLIFDPKLAPVDDDTRDAVLASLSGGGEPNGHLNAAKGVVMCDVCDGWGQLRYPTRATQTQTQQCPRCLAAGYVTKDDPQAAPVFQFPPPNTNTTGDATFTYGSAPDAWGRPVGHRDYGVPPAQVGA